MSYANMAKRMVQYGFIKVGRLKAPIARIAHLVAADIVVDKNHIKHIGEEHKSELNKLAISALDYIKLVVSSYKEIRQNKGTSILLVKVNNENDDDTVTIELTLNKQLKQWEVKTAQPRRDLRTNKLLYSGIQTASPLRKSRV